MFLPAVPLTRLDPRRHDSLQKQRLERLPQPGKRPYVSNGTERRSSASTNCTWASSLGEIYADAQHSYAGEFEVVKAVDREVMLRAFLKHALEGQFLKVEGLQKAMREVGRRINTDEGERLARSFDLDGNGGIECKEFEFGLNNMVGMEMPHGLGQEFFQANSEYAGEFYEDKRHGLGILITPSHHFYLGRWEVGMRHGRGIEGRFNSSKREAMLPRSPR